MYIYVCIQNNDMYFPTSIPDTTKMNEKKNSILSVMQTIRPVKYSIISKHSKYRTIFSQGYSFTFI